jgi:pimeloyl-ACP methyl ester carboxylesterase
VNVSRSTVWTDESGPHDAPPILLIHGSMDRSSGMLKLSRQLDDRYRVIRYDRRGYARSVDHPGPFDMAAQVADAVHVLGGRRAVVVGHSYGGNIALALAQRHAHVVAAVAVYETPLSWEPWWPGSTAGAVALTSPDDAAAAAEMFMRRMIGDTRWEGLPERTREARRTEGVAMTGELGDLRSHAPWSGDAIAQPVIAGFGSKARQHHQAAMTHVVSRIADATLVELDGCRHDAPLSHAPLFAEQIVEPILRRAGAPWSSSAQCSSTQCSSTQ